MQYLPGFATLKHFNAQIEHYAKDDLRPVYFYPDELKGRSSALTARG